MKNINLIKIIKITFGCCLAFAIAEKLNLQYSTSAIIITLLSILNTRKDTFQTAKKRFLAFFLAALTSWILFPTLNFTVTALGAYLMICCFLCQYFQVVVGFSMSTVLMLHVWKSQVFNLQTFANELALMIIGILAGILVNLYMPNKVKQIKAAQTEIEYLMKEILNSLADTLHRDRLDEKTHSLMEQLNTRLEKALLDAEYTENNGVFRNYKYYTDYIRMRIEQYELLKRIHVNQPRLHESYDQTVLAADFMREVSLSLHEHNNAVDLLKSLRTLREEFRTKPLPATRTEFESRAVLYEIVNELQELLLLKHHFAENLSQEQIRRFWLSDSP